MKRHRFFIYGLLLSLLIHLSFLLSFININIPLKAPKQPIYISVLNKPEKPQVIKTAKPTYQEIKKPHKSHAMKNKTHSQLPKTIEKTTENVNYNLAIPSLEKATIKNKNNIPKKVASSNKISKEPENSNNSEKASKPSKSNSENNTSTRKPPSKELSKNKPKPQEVMKPKPISTLGSYFDLIGYLEVVFHYIHEHCKGKGVLMFELYKDGSLKLLEVKKGNPTCESNIEAPPMPSSVMENSLEFLIYIP